MGGYEALAFWRRHAPDGGRTRAREHALGRRRATRRGKAERRWQRACAPRATASSRTAPPPLLSAEAPEALRKQVQDLIRKQPAEAIAAAALGMAARPDSAPDLASIAVPTLVDHVQQRHA